MSAPSGDLPADRSAAPPASRLSHEMGSLNWETMGQDLSLSAGGRAILDLLANDNGDHQGLIELLFGAGLPLYAEAGDDVSERIILAVRELHNAGVDTLGVRIALADRLARLIEAEPENVERIPALPARGDLLFTLYRLAQRLSVPPTLFPALKRAIGRDEARREAGEPPLYGPDYEGRSARAFLFDAAVVNQTDSDLKCFWLRALDDAEVRKFWDVSWRDARGGIRFMPDVSSGQPQPAWEAMSKSLRPIAQRVEEETSEPSTRLERFSESINLYCSAWPNQIERADIAAFTMTEDLPRWARGVLNNTDLRRETECTALLRAMREGEAQYSEELFWRDGDEVWLQRQIDTLKLATLDQRRKIPSLAHAAVRTAERQGGNKPLAKLLAKARAVSDSSAPEHPASSQGD